MSEEDPTRYTGEKFLAAGQNKPKSEITDPEDTSVVTEPHYERFDRPSKRGPKRIHKIAVWLALATVLSTFLAGVGAWVPMNLLSSSWQLDSLMPIRQALLANWLGGLQFALGLMAILIAHEFGHYLLTIAYRVPSTPPLFIPFPFVSPIGTMGAVIMMQSGEADRRQIFDIGIAGPIAGLVVAFPIIIYGLINSTPLDYTTGDASIYLGQPLLIQWMATWLVPERADQFVQVANTSASPLLMAGWVGLLVTGLNMMPLGQLDGGHVTFGLLGKNAIWLARTAAIAAIAYMVYARVIFFALMLFLVFLMGLRHPPSSDDSKTLGLGRQILGWISLVLPILCIPERPIDTVPQL